MTVASVLLSHPASALIGISPEAASSGLAVLAGAFALATAAMWHVLRWLTGDGRASLGAGAMALYALVAVPTTALGTVLDTGEAMDVARLATHLVVVSLLLASSMESMVSARPGSRKLLVAGLLVVIASIAFGLADPADAQALAQVPTLRWLLVAGWVLAGVRVSRMAMRHGQEPSLRVGLGLTLLAVAHCYRLATEFGYSDSVRNQTFATLRLVALAFIAAGALQYCKRAMQRVKDELRPRAPGPSAYTQLAVDAFEIAPSVAQTVARYRAVGLDIRCEIAPGLMTRGSREVLTQVLALLLSDSARYAPGSPIRVLAWDAGWRVLLRVSDEGPSDPGAVVTGPAVTDSDEREHGLRACRDLLAGIGGEIRLHRGGQGHPGCMIQVELPVAAADSDQDIEPLVDEARFSTFATEQAERASRVFDEATRAARRVASSASRPPGAGRLDGPTRLGLALALFLATVAISRVPPVMHWLVTREVGVSLALVAVAAGVLSAFACGVLGQLGDEPAGLWLSAGLAFYSVVGVPAATYNANTPDSEAALSNVRFVANATFVALTLAAVLMATRPRRDGSLVLFGALLLGLGAAALGVMYPAESLALSTSPTIRLALSMCWLASGVMLVAAGGVRRTSWLSWVGIGCTLIAIAHAQRAAAGSPFIPLGSTFTSVRLLGVLLLAAGVLPAARLVLVEAYNARHRQLAELQEAQSGLQRFAERDHDILGGLAALANANMLLESRVRPQEEQDELRAAVNSELNRLNQLLRPPAVEDGGDEGYDYEIADVIQERITLQTNPDMDVRVDIEPNLWVHGNPLILAQVLANVLTNWQRHAPGSPLRIQAMHHGHTAVLRVCDFGPGIPAELETKVFDLAVRRPESPGQGFGLHICRRLLEDESGQIYIQRRRGRGTGCTVIIELPAAEADGPGRSDLADRSAG